MESKKQFPIHPMEEIYKNIIQTVSPDMLYKLPHTYVGTYPTGFIVVSTEPIVQTFPFTVCPLRITNSLDSLPGNPANAHDVIVQYSSNQGPLETLLYKLYEEYKSTGCEKTECSMKRYVFRKTYPLRKVIIPCFQRKENLQAVLQRFQMIQKPVEGYAPKITLVEHSPFPEHKQTAEQFNCEYLWFFLDPSRPEIPIGQFNKALCFDKAFLYSSPAYWYLFHDNDVLVPKNFWKLLDENADRASTQFLQPYTHRSLLNLKPEIAEEFRKDLTHMDKPIPSEHYYPICPGAPGGSLYLSRTRYLEAGGHDPQLCWGYGPEDLLFFKKLQLLEPLAFADNPPIELVHLWHPPAALQNPLLSQMDSFVKIYFEQLPNDQKLGYMQYKRNVLESLLTR
jgi:hypothetical protein